MLKSAFGVFWGPRPELMRWAYTAIVRPAFIFGSFVWAKQSYTDKFKNTFRTLQRLATLTMSPVRKSTPSRGLEVITHLMPLELFMEGENIKALLRLEGRLACTWSGQGKSKTIRQTGHIKWANNLRNDLGITTAPRDTIPSEVSFKRNYKVEKISTSQGRNTHSKGLRVYTDGSKMEAPHTDTDLVLLGDKDDKDHDKMPTGAGFVILNKSPDLPIVPMNGIGMIDELSIEEEESQFTKEALLEGHTHLGKLATVFQAEITAITLACKAIGDMDLSLIQDGTDVNDITIYTDSQAAFFFLKASPLQGRLAR
jgi:hypothetical protein